jgi:UDP-N-acetylmuramate dehydrogenase
MSYTKVLSTALSELAKNLPADRTWKNDPMADHTYIKLGGAADVLTVARTGDELAAAVTAAEKLGVPWFILGGGSNILVGDLGVRGLVIKNEARKLVAGGWWLVAESGALLSQLASFAIDHGLAGLEPFMSVPGTLGGAIYNNSHFRPSKNEFIGNLVEEAEILEGRRKKEEGREGGKGQEGRKTVDKEWFNFGYDYSRLQEEKAVILRVKFKLEKSDPEKLRARSMEFLKQRNQYQPIGRPSCGCMFKNPDGMSAGKLIDEAGMKGVRVGGISVSETHANFMVNDGTGKVADVLELMAWVKKRVKDFHRIDLEPEIFMKGDFSSKMVRIFQKTRNTRKTGISDNQRIRISDFLAT